MNHWDRIYENGAYKNQWDYKYPSQELVATIAYQGVPLNGEALDVGCGAGRDAIFLAQSGFKVMGLDLSEKALEIAGERAKETNVEVKWVCGNVLELPVETESIDFINDRGCFHAISESDRPQYVQEISRVLKPGGKLLLRGFGCLHAHGVTPVTEEQINHLFNSIEFRKGPFLNLAMVSDAGEIKGNIVIIQKHH